jgi:hypothetical protein
MFLESAESITLVDSTPFGDAPGLAIGSKVVLRSDQLDSVPDTRRTLYHEMAPLA